MSGKGVVIGNELFDFIVSLCRTESKLRIRYDVIHIGKTFRGRKIEVVVSVGRGIRLGTRATVRLWDMPENAIESTITLAGLPKEFANVPRSISFSRFR